MNFLIKNKQYIKYLIFILITSSLYLVAFGLAAEQPTNGLIINPKQCVALHQGKKCYVDIQISWTTQQQSNYCLFSSLQNEALKCWSQQSSGTFKQEVVANENVQFYLKKQANNTILQSTELEMKWVYQKNAKPRSYWRAF